MWRDTRRMHDQDMFDLLREIRQIINRRRRFSTEDEICAIAEAAAAVIQVTCPNTANKLINNELAKVVYSAVKKVTKKNVILIREGGDEETFFKN